MTPQGIRTLLLASDGAANSAPEAIERNHG